MPFQAKQRQYPFSFLAPFPPLRKSWGSHVMMFSKTDGAGGFKAKSSHSLFIMNSLNKDRHLTSWALGFPFTWGQEGLEGGRDQCCEATKGVSGRNW